MSEPIQYHKRSISPSASPSKEVGSPKKISKDMLKEKDVLSTAGPFKGLPFPFQPSSYQSSMPYIPCNEDGQEKSLEFLKSNLSTIPLEKKVHLGFSIWFNFDLISCTKPAYAIICDIDNHVINVFKAIGECLEQSENRFQFVQHFRTYLLKNSMELFNLESLSEVEKIFKVENELQRKGSWLSLEPYFQVIKLLYQKGHILFLRLDIITDKDIFNLISNWLAKNQLELDTLYVANIIEWIPEKLKQEAYLQNLRTIASERTRFIQAYRMETQKVPIQYCSLGSRTIQVPVKKAPKKYSDPKFPK